MTVTDDRATATEAPAREVGRARRRKEDARLITGRTTWTDNLVLPGMLHLAIVRSPVAHARIRGIDVTAAREAPGVVAVFTGRDFAEEQGSLFCVWTVTPDMVNPGHPSIAVEEVNHVGEAVAVIAARSKAAAQDAVELVDVDYEPLPVVLDMEEALVEGAPLTHDHLQSNQSFRFVLDSGEAGTGADVEQTFADAEVVVSRRFVQQRLIPAFMEPRAVAVQPMGDTYTLWSSTQVPHIVRLVLAMVTGMPEHRLRVIAPDVGGGFGGKLQVTPEEVLCLLVARRLGKPVKWNETRSESLMSGHHGRDQIQYIDVAADREGNVKGIRARLVSDMGAYLRLVTPGIPILGAFMFGGIYKFPAYRFDCTGVFTNKTPTDAYRGAGRPEATFAVERIMDELAVELGMDPLELRRKNWIKADEFPFTTSAGLQYDSGDYDTATAQALELVGYDELRAEQRRRREAGDPVQLGIGFSTFTEMCGLAPSRVLGSLSYAAGGWEHASVRMLPTGKVEVVTGTSPHGQGHETAWSQLVADRLGVPFEDVEVLHGDTAVAHRGLDTYGSRSLVVGGAAVVEAAEKVVAKARRVAAHLLEASEDDLEFADGKFAVRGTPGSEISIQDVALATFSSHNFPEGMESSIDADATFDPTNFSYPHGTHICAVEVDTETGMVKIRRYGSVDDVGVVVNPMIVEGQIHGGVAQGIAQALYEEAVYDDDGNLTTGTFVDYLVPSAADLPHFETGTTVHAAPGNPIGAKGVGEAGCIASTPAMVNAVLDAVRHLGVSDIRMPLTPERVWRAIHGGDGSTHPTAPDRAAAGTVAYGGAQTETTTGVTTDASSLGGDR
jgi:aerobic carbon-monoxide dehydrogenase large subunit